MRQVRLHGIQAEEVIGVSIPKKKRATKSRARAKPKVKTETERRESAEVRYLFYLITLAMVLLVFFSVELLYTNQISMPLAEALSSAALSLFLPLFALSYMLHEGKSIKRIIRELGLSRDKLTLKALGIGIVLFFCIIALEIGFGAFSATTGIQLPTNVQTLLAGTPLWFLVFTFLIAPIDEEIFFRGFLIPHRRLGLFILAFVVAVLILAAFAGAVQWVWAAALAIILIALAMLELMQKSAFWLGILISSMIFAISHIAYLSIAEFAAAFVFGILAGYVFSKRDSLYSTILAHMLVNVLAVASFISFGMLIYMLH